MIRMKVKVTTTEELLGVSPADPDVYTKWIATGAENADLAQEEIQAITDAAEQENFEKGLTVFPRLDGEPFVWNYQWKGLFKDACGMLRRVPNTESSKMKAYKKIIDGLIFVEERKIPIKTDEEITICERPLRADTAQGPRIALAASEAIAPGATMEFTVRCLVDADMKAVKEWLDYGMIRGFGGWRNSSKGTFTYEILEETKSEYTAA